MMSAARGGATVGAVVIVARVALSDVCESMSSRRCRDRTAASPGDDEMKYEL